mmetsp:Transcript_15250/g.41784  ORF Transcript_15250/g.41784 Transcript_15250/m.41784 type:complete len:233 (-) Transcript_15250:447-1145(-)
MSSNVLELARAVQQLQEQIANERVCRESEVSFLWDEVFRLRSEKNGPLLNGTMMEPQRVKNGDERCQQNVHNERVVDDAENHVEKNTFLFDSWDMEKTVEGKSEMQRLKQEADRVALEAQIAVADHRLHQIEEHFEEFFKNFALVENLMKSTRRQIKDHERALEVVRSSFESFSDDSSRIQARSSGFGVETFSSMSSSLMLRMGVLKPSQGSETDTIRSSVRSSVKSSVRHG